MVFLLTCNWFTGVISSAQEYSCISFPLESTVWIEDKKSVYVAQNNHYCMRSFTTQMVEVCSRVLTRILLRAEVCER